MTVKKKALEYDESVSTPCVRCGTARVVLRRWTEKVEVYGGVVEVSHTETVCPDPDCQELVGDMLDKMAEKKRDMERRKQERLEAVRGKKKAKH